MKTFGFVLFILFYSNFNQIHAQLTSDTSPQVTEGGTGTSQTTTTTTTSNSSTTSSTTAPTTATVAPTTTTTTTTTTNDANKLMQMSNGLLVVYCVIQCFKLIHFTY